MFDVGSDLPETLAFLLCTGTGQVTSTNELFGIYTSIFCVLGILASAPSRTVAVYLTFAMSLSLVTFFSFSITIFILAPSHQTANFVFNSWQDHSADTGVYSRGFSFLLGTVSAIATLSGWDTTIYMTEECLRPTYAVPAALWRGFVWVGSCSGLSLVMLLFSIQDPNQLHSSSAVFGGTGPVSQILWDVTQARFGSGSASAMFMVLIAMSLFMMCLFLLIGTSRKLYAMSRWVFASE